MGQNNPNRIRIVYASLLASAILVVLNTSTSLGRFFAMPLSSSTLSDMDRPNPLTDKINNQSSTHFHPFTIANPINMTLVSPQGEVSTDGSLVSSSIAVQQQQQQQQQQEEPVRQTKKPLNILILYPDDLRHDSIGAAGTQPVMTPFLDSLAQEGIRFTYNCVTTSICWISRATMFTGQYFARHKSEFLPHPVFCDRWNETWPYLLQQAGYYVGHSGKWQFYNGDFVQRAFNWTSLHEGYHWYRYPGGGQNGKPLMQHACDKSELEVIDFIRNRPKDRPFAITVAYYPPKAIGIGPVQWFPKNETKALYENMTIPEPYRWNESWHRLPSFFHTRNEARTRWEQRFGTSELYQNSMKCYYALITEVDKACEHIVDELKRQGIYDDTMIIFTSDNGFFLGEHGLAGKWYPYQESIRVPLIIRDPRMPKNVRGTLDDSFTLNIDLATTILGAANLPPHERMQGRDIADLYLTKDGKDTWRKEFFYQHQSMGADYIPASSALVRKDFKYMIYPEWNVEQLFDMLNDPLEFTDIHNQSQYSALMEEMRKRHDELKEQVN